MGIVQQSTFTTTGNVASASTSFDSLPTAGSTIVVTGAIYATSEDFDGSEITDNQGNTYVVAVQKRVAAGAAATAFIAYAEDIGSPSGTFTITADFGSNHYHSLRAMEIDNVLTSPLDVVASNSGTGTSRSSGTTATTAQAQELLIAVCAHDGNGTLTVSGGWTESWEQTDSGSHQAGEADYQEVSATGTYSASWTGGPSTDWAGVIATFKLLPVTDAIATVVARTSIAAAAFTIELAAAEIIAGSVALIDITPRLGAATLLGGSFLAAHAEAAAAFDPAERAPTYILEISRGLLGLEEWTELTGCRIIGFATHRGYDHALSGVTAGTLAVGLDDDDGAFDPDNEDSPYAGVWGLMCGIRLIARYHGIDYPLAYCYVDSATPQLVGIGASVAVHATDYFKRLGFPHIDFDMTATIFGPDTNPTYGTGAAIGHVLTTAGFASGYMHLDGGNTTLRTKKYAGAAATQMIDDFVKADPGMAWINGAGEFWYLDRSTLHAREPIASFGAQGDYPIHHTHTGYSDAGIYNRVVVGSAVAEDVDSQDLYDVREYVAPAGMVDLLIPGDYSTMANYLLGRQSQPASRIQAIDVDPAADPALWPIVLASDVGQKITVKHNIAGFKGVIDQDYWIVGVDHHIGEAPPHYVTWQLLKVQGVF